MASNILKARDEMGLMPYPEQAGMLIGDQAAQLYGHIGIFTSGQEGGLFRGPLDSMEIKTIPNYRRGKAMATPLCCGHKHTDTNSK
ncbi:hypothetical protein OS493_010449 [Desmophyllum pertusum]|uniref:Uncharacterized protein n=1 Tax=Desmophyllum pertusum TaxID=174260 RepID=A0A9X0DAJ0_9CNID|nr:hypothetical protein OS493_010449 [Desmophyllum pertusum]